MCGRYTLTKLEELLRQFPFVTAPVPEARARYNIAPTQPVLAVANHHADRFEFFHWGLVPSWAKVPSVGGRMINARAETLADRPAFRTALRRRRCLVPADGFYEWKRSADGKTKTPIYVRLKGGRPFAFAGLWDVWHGPDGSALPSCTIVTGPPNDLLAPIHDRMAVILPPAAYGQWLDPRERDPAELTALLKPYPADQMEAFAVSRTVNNARNETPDCVAPVADE